MRKSIERNKADTEPPPALLERQKSISDNNQNCNYEPHPYKRLVMRSLFCQLEGQSNLHFMTAAEFLCDISAVATVTVKYVLVRIVVLKGSMHVLVFGCVRVCVHVTPVCVR